MKLIFSVFFVFLLSCVFVSADPLEITFGKESYSSSETLQAEIIISDIENELGVSNIKLFQGSSPVPISPFFFDYGNDYYVYFQLIGLDDGNYSFVVEDVVYYHNDLLVQGDFSKDFSVVEKSEVLSIDPGFIDATNFRQQSSFEVEVENELGGFVDVTFEADDGAVSLSEDSITLVDEHVLGVYVSEFLLGDLSTKYLTISYGDESYIVPIWLGGFDEVEENETNTSDDNYTEPESGVVFLTDLDLLILREGKSKVVSIDFQNVGENPEELSFELEGNLSIISSLEHSELTLASGEIAKQTIYVNSDKTAELGAYFGNLKINGGEYEFEIVVALLAEDEEIPDVIINPPAGNDTNTSSDDDDDEEPETDFAWILIIIAVVVILLIIVFILYKRYKRRQETKLPFFR